MRYSKIRYCGLTLAAIGIMAVGGAAIVLMAPPGPSLTKAVLLSLLSVAAIGVGLSSYRNADEIILHTHKTAWFWGTMAAYCVILPVLIAALWHLVRLPVLLPNTFGDAFAEGALFVILVQAVGFAIFWAYENLRRR